MAATGREPGVEFIGNGLCPKYADRPGQVCVGPDDPGMPWPNGVRFEMHHLTAGVNAGVGPSGANGMNGRIGNPG